VNKNELISAVADSASITKTDAAKAVDAVFSTISTSLGTGTEVRLTGFGTFTVTSRKATTGRNPRTGEAIQIPASKLPKFRPGKTLRESVN
jgi:DNA-binding protein HU-beta